MVDQDNIIGMRPARGRIICYIERRGDCYTTFISDLTPKASGGYNSIKSWERDHRTIQSAQDHASKLNKRLEKTSLAAAHEIIDAISCGKEID
jgi:hypothetical protein